MVQEITNKANPILDVSQILQFKKDLITGIKTAFAGANNDLDLTWSAGGGAGGGKTAIFRLPVTASAALAVVEDGSNNADIILASDTARVTTQTPGAGSDDWAVTRPGGNTTRFTYNGSGGDDWALSTVVAGDIATMAGFDASNDGTHVITVVDDAGDFIEIESTTGLVEDPAGTSIVIYPLDATANTGTLVGAAIDALTSWTSVNASGNDGSGAITTATPDFATAAPASPVEIYTLTARNITNPVATIVGVIPIKPGRKYMLRNVTATMHIKLSFDGTGAADANDIPIFVDESITFQTDGFNQLHADAITGTLIEIE